MVGSKQEMEREGGEDMKLKEWKRLSHRTGRIQEAATRWRTSALRKYPPGKRHSMNLGSSPGVLIHPPPLLNKEN